MTAKTDYFENLIVEHAFRGAGPLTFPANWYVALFTDNPGEAGAGTEVTGGGYARVAVANSATEWAAPVGGNGQTSNLNPVVFPTPVDDYSAGASITHWGLCDAATGGNVMIYAPLQSAVTVLNGETDPTFPVGALIYTEDN